MAQKGGSSSRGRVGGRDTLKVRDPNCRSDCTAQGPSARKQSLITSGCKTQWGLGWQKKLLDFQDISLKGPTSLKIYVNPPTLGFNNWITAGHASPGSTKSPKQVGHKEDHTKTHHN